MPGGCCQAPLRLRLPQNEPVPVPQPLHLRCFSSWSSLEPCPEVKMIKLTSEIEAEETHQYSPATTSTIPVKNECNIAPGLWDSSEDLSHYCTFCIYDMSSCIWIRQVSSRIASWHEYTEWYMWNIILMKSLNHHIFLKIFYTVVLS